MIKLKTFHRELKSGAKSDLDASAKIFDLFVVFTFPKIAERSFVTVQNAWFI